MKKILKTKNFQNWKRGNHRKFDFSIQRTHVGAGKSAFSVFLRKSWKFTKITEFIKILEISINLVKKSSFLPEAEKSGNTQSES